MVETVVGTGPVDIATGLVGNEIASTRLTSPEIHVINVAIFLKNPVLLARESMRIAWTLIRPVRQSNGMVDHSGVSIVQSWLVKPEAQVLLQKGTCSTETWIYRRIRVHVL